MPIAAFKAHASTLLRQLSGSGEPVVLTVNGRPAGIVLSPGEYDRLREHVRFLESVVAGMADVHAGRVMDTPELKRRLDARRRARRK